MARVREWVRTVKVSELPYAEIPVNREVKYEVPRPAVPLEKLEMLPDYFVVIFADIVLKYRRRDYLTSRRAQSARRGCSGRRKAMNEFASEISRHVWRSKDRYVDHTVSEHRISDSWRRIARALAMVEPKDNVRWGERFFSILQGFKFLPGGRI